jgi:hypothetical protein
MSPSDPGVSPSLDFKAVKSGTIYFAKPSPQSIFELHLPAPSPPQPTTTGRLTDKMAQGAVKKTAKPTPTGKGGKAPSKQQAKKSGVGKSKKSKSTADKIQKKFTAGLAARTEQMLGERAGHLELIGKGRKKGAEKEFKGGSRKFG